MTSGSQAIRCMIIDEHPIVRQGVQALLEATWHAVKVSVAIGIRYGLTE